MSRPVLKRIESFLVGDSSSPEVFFGLQESAARTLRELHFPAFVASPKCRRMIEEAATAGIVLGYEQTELWGKSRFKSSQAGPRRGRAEKISKSRTKSLSNT